MAEEVATGGAASSVAALLHRLNGHASDAVPPARASRSPGPAWPGPLDPAAFHGLAGDLVRAMQPHTEADPVALLGNVLTMYSSSVGRGPHTLVGAGRHGTNLAILQVGETAKARKGTAQAGPRRAFREADPEWERRCVTSGLSSGEGLIWAVRDKIEKTEPIKEKGRVVGYQTVTTDPGVEDKRLLVIEQEFASVLKVIQREGNTLSPTVRDAWDGLDVLRTLTKNSPATATGAHVAIIGNITREELLRHLDSTEAANGFANRFLVFCVRRARLLPESGRVPDAEMGELGRRLGAALAFGRRAGEVQRDDEARELWAEVYPDLSAGRPGLIGAVTARAEAQVLRLSLNYALLDKSKAIRAAHLLAALAVWDYCDASAHYIFGDAVGDPVADRILNELRLRGQMTQNDVVNLFGRHATGPELDRALASLVGANLVAAVRDADTGGRPRTVWSPA